MLIVGTLVGAVGTLSSTGTHYRVLKTLFKTVTSSLTFINNETTLTYS